MCFRAIGLLFLLLVVSCQDAGNNPGPTLPLGDPAHSLRVVSPNGDEMFRVGDTITIVISGASAAGYMGVIEWSWDRGEHWAMVTDNAVEVDGTVEVELVIPDSVRTFVESAGSITAITESPVSSQCLVKVYDYDRVTEGIVDQSDKPFSILP